MKIKRYVAKDVRQAMRLIREEQGPDAVILSNRKVQNGVEIVSAMDYDESALEKSRAQQKRAKSAGLDVLAVESRQQFLPPDVDSRGVKQALSDIQWSQDPLLIEMRSDLESVKTMLKHQLSAIAWGESARNNPYRAELIHRLLRMGLSAGLCKRLMAAHDEVQGLDQKEMWQKIMADLSAMLPSARNDCLTEGGVYSLIGATGVGKTTTTAKIAARAAMRYGHRQVALITIDNYRVGAYEQLRSYGRILDVPVRHATSHEALKQALADFSGRRLVLIDSAGMCQHDGALMAHMALFDGLNVPVRSLLLLSATTSLAGLMDVANAFSKFSPAACVFTKLDEAMSLGGVLSAAILNHLPVIFSCDGQKVPEDIQVASPKDLAARCEVLGERKSQDELLEFSELTGMGEVANAGF